MAAICFLAIAISVSFEARLERLGRRKGSGGLVRRFGSLGCGRSGEAKARARACGGPVVSRDVKQWPEEEARAGPLRQPGGGRGVVVCSLRACPSLRVARPGPGRA